MAEYITFDPANEIIGHGALANITALDRDDIQHFLQKHNLTDIEPDSWYPHQPIMDLLRDINEANFLNLVAVGMNVPKVAAFPPHIDSIEKALGMLDIAYQMNHRGPDIGYYHFESTGERSGKMICKNPYPSDFDYGLVYALVKNFRPADSVDFSVVRDETVKNRTTGGDTCVYHIEW